MPTTSPKGQFRNRRHVGRRPDQVTVPPVKGGDIDPIGCLTGKPSQVSQEPMIDALFQVGDDLLSRFSTRSKPVGRHDVKKLPVNLFLESYLLACDGLGLE